MADPTGYVPPSYLAALGAGSSYSPYYSIASDNAGLGFVPPGFMPYDPSQNDPSLGTNVLMPDGTYRNFPAGTTPKIFIGDEFPGGYAAAVPGTEEYDHYTSLQNRSDVQGAAQVAAIVGGGALAGSLLGGGAAAAGGVGDAGGAAGGSGFGSAIGGGAATGAGELSPITLPASATYLGSGAGSGMIGGVGSALDSGLSGSSLLFPMADNAALLPVISSGTGAAAGGAGVGGWGTAGAGAAGAASGIPEITNPGQYVPGPGNNVPLDPNATMQPFPGEPNWTMPNVESPGIQGPPAPQEGPPQTPPVSSSIPSWLSALSPYAGLIGAGLGLVDSALQPKSTTQTNNATNSSTNTSSLQLPSQITGPASDALARAGTLLGQGQQFAPMPYGINKAAGDLATLGSNNAPTTSSFASGANINPYLDMTFNAAADATQNRQASEFANAGQYGSPQNQQARSQELQQLAAGIYGPGYQNAQNLQYGAQEAGVQRGLTQQDSNLNRTVAASQAALPIGQYMQQQQQQQLNSPTTSLNSYISQLGGLSPYFPGTSTQSQAGTQTGNYTQPIYNNPLLSALGGAQLGSYFAGLGQPQQQGGAYGGTQTPQNANIGQGFGSMPAYSYL